MSLIEKTAEFIQQYQLCEAGDKVLVAVSGGADSIALLHLMVKLREMGGAEVVCVHVNHGLRAEAARRDEDFAVGQAEKLGVEVLVKQADAAEIARNRGVSVETAGRMLRHEILIAAAKRYQCAVIATGHHMDDNAETMVQRMARGTGFRGLCGIWPKTELHGFCFIRPLLAARRREIIEFLRAQQIGWQEDHTNADTVYRRNFIRHKLLPALQQDSREDLTEKLFEFSRSTQKLQGRILADLKEVWPGLAEVETGQVNLDMEQFCGLEMILRVEIVRKALKLLGCGERDMNRLHYQRILGLCDKKTGTKVELPGQFYAQRVYEHLVIGNDKENWDFQPVEIVVGQRTESQGVIIETKLLENDKDQFRDFLQRKDEHIERFDLDKIRGRLVLRKWQAGDRFVPIGMKGHKSVSDFLTDAKISPRMRNRGLVLQDEKKILWLWPFRGTEQAKIKPETKQVLEIKIRNRLIANSTLTSS